jgi:hypothetical protein
MRLEAIGLLKGIFINIMSYFGFYKDTKQINNILEQIKKKNEESRGSFIGNKKGK